MARDERSAGFVAFHVSSHSTGGHSIEPASFQYLVLDHGRHRSFPKGHIEKGENDLAAAVRELREETGITGPEVVPGFRHEIEYFFRHRTRGLVRKSVTYFLARVPSRKIILSKEHVGGEFLTYERAIKRVTFASDREVLRLAHASLEDTSGQTPT